MASNAAALPASAPGVDPTEVDRQAAEVLAEQQEIVFRRADCLLVGLTILQWLVFGLGRLAPGARTPDPTPDVLIFPAVLSLLSLALAWAWPGRAVTRHALAVSQVLLCSLLSPLAVGRDAPPFPVFGVLAFLALYRDWRVLITASLLASLLPLFERAALTDAWLWLEQAGAILAEDVLLLFYCRQSAREMRWNAERQAILRAADSLVRETRVQSRWTEGVWRDAHDLLRRSHQELEAGELRRAQELARANDALQRNLSVLRAQQEATVDGILVVDETRDISSYNQRFCELWDIPPGEISAEEDWRIMPHLLSCVKQPDAFLRLMERCYDNPHEQGHDEFELADGRIFDRYTRPVFSETDQYYGRVWYFRDVTERKRAEVQIVGLNRDLTRAYEDMAQAYDATIEGWSRAMDLRDKETEGHSRRVTELTVRMAVSLGLCGEDLIQIRRGALLHDIGKMGIPDHILLKPGKLTDDEWVIMRRHPTYAYEMLSPIAFLRPALDIPFCHHEKWDGTGYPRGLKNEDIPLSARLFAIVDVWDALRSDRPYRQAWSEDRVKDHILSFAGSHFDPELVRVFVSVITENDILSDISQVSSLDFYTEDTLSEELPRAA